MLATYADDDFVAEDLTARHDVEIPELGLLPPVEVELKEDGPEDRERLPVDADPRFLPVVQHGIGNGDLEIVHVQGSQRCILSILTINPCVKSNLCTCRKSTDTNSQLV